jgi:hypothetical protein
MMIAASIGGVPGSCAIGRREGLFTMPVLSRRRSAPIVVGPPVVAYAGPSWFIARSHGLASDDELRAWGGRLSSGVAYPPAAVTYRPVVVSSGLYRRTAVGGTSGGNYTVTIGCLRKETHETGLCNLTFQDC